MGMEEELIASVRRKTGEPKRRGELAAWKMD